MSIYLTINDACAPIQPWSAAYILVLDICLLLRSEEDETRMKRLSLLLRLAMVAYLAVRALVICDVLPGIGKLHEGNRAGPHGYSNETNTIIEFLWRVVPLLVNYSLMESYATSARREAGIMNCSVQMASQMASKLVHFDLDAAQSLLLQTDLRSPIHKPMSELIRNLRSYATFLPHTLFDSQPQPEAEEEDPPNQLMAAEMRGLSISREHALAAVQRLRDPDYSLKDFHHDVTTAFPELALYSLGGDGPCSSGRTGLEEYQRTMGAMFSVYCLARLDLDGKEVFTFGVDEDWQPMQGPHGTNADNMRNFYVSMDWDGLGKLLTRADLLIPPERNISGGTTPDYTRTASLAAGPSPRQRRSIHPEAEACGFSRAHDSLPIPTNNWQQQTALEVNGDRMLAMLVLTAVHDVMKNANLLPVVQGKHSPYRQHLSGSQISDHDVALAYVMEHFPSMLPSYHGLGPGQRAPVLFTQSKMGFNNGWLVQGEAPPGALFSTFKQVIEEGRVCDSDVNFYFVHWLTDLAGAEPYHLKPWPGAEKFVTKFPLQVLNAFLESFRFVGQLATKSEVDVMQAYLQSRWRALGPPAQLAKGGHSVAVMRVALMAQGFEADAVRELLSLPRAELDLLAEEMARTGRRQQYQFAPASVLSQPAGPALLVYYAPALVQKAGAARVGNALRVLAAVCRAARQLFPAATGRAALETTVIIRIDALKELLPEEIVGARKWHLLRTSESEAQAVRGSPPAVPRHDTGGRLHAVIEVQQLSAAASGEDVPSECGPWTVEEVLSGGTGAGPGRLAL